MEVPAFAGMSAVRCLPAILLLNPNLLDRREFPLPESSTGGLPVFLSIRRQPSNIAKAVSRAFHIGKSFDSEIHIRHLWLLIIRCIVL